MTLDDLAAKLDEQGKKIDAQGAKIDARFEALEQKVDQGFNDSKTRDEELRDLMKFGLEAREVLRDEMHRQFNAADEKNNEQIKLLKDAVRHLSPSE